MKIFFFNWFFFDKKTVTFYLLMNIYDLIYTSIGFFIGGLQAYLAHPLGTGWKGSIGRRVAFVDY